MVNAMLTGKNSFPKLSNARYAIDQTTNSVRLLVRYAEEVLFFPSCIDFQGSVGISGQIFSRLSAFNENENT